MPRLLESVDDIPDPRTARTRRRSLRDILVLSVLAVICGADGFVQIEDFGKAKEMWPHKTLDLPNGIPSHDTIGRIFSMLCPKAFSAGFIRSVGTVAEMVPVEVVAIDGKTVGRSQDGATNRGPIHLVNTWVTVNRLFLGQIATSAKSNEINAIPEFLAALELRGCIVTIDAMGCQKSIAPDIIEAEAAYVLALEHNRPTLGLLRGRHPHPLRGHPARLPRGDHRGLRPGRGAEGLDLE